MEGAIKESKTCILQVRIVKEGDWLSIDLNDLEKKIKVGQVQIQSTDQNILMAIGLLKQSAHNWLWKELEESFSKLFSEEDVGK